MPFENQKEMVKKFVSLLCGDENQEEKPEK